MLASARGLPGRRARCSLGFRIGAVAPRSNFLAHFSCVIVVSAAQRAASKADAAGCAVGYLLAKKTELSWLACDPFCSRERAFAHRGEHRKGRTAAWSLPRSLARCRIWWGSLALSKWEMQPSPGDADERRRDGRCPNNARAERRRGEARLGPQCLPALYREAERG